MHCHDVDLLLAEPGFQQAISEESEAVLDRWVIRLTEIGAENDPMHTDCTNMRKSCLPRHFPAEQWGKAVLEKGSRFSERDLVLDGHCLGGKIWMRHDNMPNTFLSCGMDDGENLITTEVSGCENQVMTSDDSQDSSEFRYDIASVIDNLDRGNIESRLAHFLLKSCPVWQLASRGSVAKVATFVRGIDRWQPHDARTFPGCDLHCERVQSPDCTVERDRPENVNTRNGRAHNGSSLGSGNVMRLDHVTSETDLAKSLRERDIVDAPWHDVWTGVDMEIVRSTDELARSLARNR